MNIQDIKKLLEIFDKSGAAKLSLKDETFEISLEKPTFFSEEALIHKPIKMIQSVAENTSLELDAPLTPPSVETAGVIKPDSETLYIKSPMVGTFYRAPSPDAAPFVNVGDVVKKGQSVAIIEAMKIMNKIDVEYDCKIKEILIENAKIVEFDTPLFVVEKI